MMIESLNSFINHIDALVCTYMPIGSKDQDVIVPIACRHVCPGVFIRIRVCHQSEDRRP